jgi:hypothetical protein
MEDLGTISINIKDSGGGGGGGGSMSGGIGGGLLSLRPSAMSERGLIRINQAVIYINQAAIQQMQQGMTHALTGAVRASSRGMGGVGGGSSSGGPAAPQSMWQRIQAKLGMVETGSAIKGELGGFLRNPSAGGMASLLSSSASTGKAIAMLGAAAAPVAAVLAVVLLGVVAGIAAYKLLQASAERVARKFDEVTRFSGAMMFAKASERLQVFNRQIADAAKNGMAYAKAQSFATLAADAHAETMLHFDAASAELAQVWHRLSMMFWKALLPLAKFAEWLAKSVDWGNALLFGLTNLMGGLGLSTLFPILNAIYNKTAQIQRNTQPSGGTAANEWFMQDINAVMGKGKNYSDLGYQKKAAK